MAYPPKQIVRPIQRPTPIRGYTVGQIGARNTAATPEVAPKAAKRLGQNASLNKGSEGRNTPAGPRKDSSGRNASSMSGKKNSGIY